ncbi:hypothetical protein NOCA2210140 [metagenome]|uniref:Uncharacterized protein n=1 Tax=metagenome TaxID=256318 RepID=A0A2P2BYH0_9ZZZZ
MLGGDPERSASVLLVVFALLPVVRYEHADVLTLKGASYRLRAPKPTSSRAPSTRPRP